MGESRSFESIKASGEELVERVRALIHEGNVRRIIIRQEGRVVAEFPLTFGVVGAVLAPVLAAVSVLAALLTDCTIDVERTVTPVADQAADATQPALPPSQAEAAQAAANEPEH